MRVDPSCWTPWDEALLAGKSGTDHLPFLTDEALIELLATGDPHTRSYELSIIATELENRLVRFRRLVDKASERTDDAMGEALEASDRAQDRAVKTASSVRDHIEVRGDQISDEPTSSLEAARATRDTHEALEDVQHAQGLLARARGELGRRARDP